MFPGLRIWVNTEFLLQQSELGLRPRVITRVRTSFSRSLTSENASGVRGWWEGGGGVTDSQPHCRWGVGQAHWPLFQSFAKAADRLGRRQSWEMHTF